MPYFIPRLRPNCLILIASALFTLFVTNSLEAAPNLTLTSVTFDDKLSDNNHSANPGDIIQLYPTISNIGDVNASNVTVQLTSSDPNVTIFSPSLITLGTIENRGSIAATSGLKLQLSTNLSENQYVTVQLVYGGTGLAPKTLNYRITVSRLQPVSCTKLSFAPGETIADPTRDMFYMVNRSSDYLMAIDASTSDSKPAYVYAYGKLAGSAVLSPAYSVAEYSGTGWANVTFNNLQTGQLAISPDGTKLYIALSGARKIQCFSLPQLYSLGTFNCSFTPEAIAVSSTGDLYVSNYTPVNLSTGVVYQMSSTGVVKSSFTFYIPQGWSGVPNLPNVVHTILKTNKAGTRLYVTCWPSSIYQNAHNDFKEYDISTTAPILTRSFGSTYPGGGIGGGYVISEFALDESSQAVLYASCFSSWLGRLDLASNTDNETYAGVNNQDGNGGGLGFANIPSPSGCNPVYFFGVNPSNGDYMTVNSGPCLRKKERNTLTQLLDYSVKPISTPTMSIVPRGIATTSKQKTMIIERSGFWPSYTNNGTYYVYLVGGYLGTLTGTPIVNRPPIVYAGIDHNFSGTKMGGVSGTVTDDGVPGPLTYKWTQVSGPPGAYINNPNGLNSYISVTATGSYTFRLTASDGELTASDDVNLNFY